LVSAIATGGPAAALILAYMWWRAEARCGRYEDLWVRANEELSERILELAERNRRTIERLIREVRAARRDSGGEGA